MYVKPQTKVEQVNFLASSKFQTFTYQAEKTYKAGEIFPENDGTAVGIVMNDVTVNSEIGSQPVSVIVEGYVLEKRLSQSVTSEAKEAMKEIKLR